MRRRDFIILLAGAMGGQPSALRAQQKAMPVIGFLESSSPDVFVPFVAAFRKGLSETGFIEGRNVSIEFRWAEGRYDRLPGLAAELVRIPVAVLAATGVTAALAAKAATATIPVVFHTGGDPVEFGLVASLSRPGGNVTGVVSLGKILIPKQLELLHELVPKADRIAFLVNPKNGVLQSDTNSMREAARVKGVQLRIMEAGNDREIDAVFTSLVQQQAGALVVQADPFLDGRRQQLAALAAHHAVPAIAAHPEFAAAGGLISYGTSIADAFHLEGNYAGRILNGEKPTDLPVQQSVKVELVVNLNTAKALGLTVPPSILARADEASSNEAPRIAARAGRRCDRPALSLRAAESDAGDRLSRQWLAGLFDGFYRCV
jgi:putative tryptophan/tyrosine transport system substrate-binding protein